MARSERASARDVWDDFFPDLGPGGIQALIAFCSSSAPAPRLTGSRST